MDKVVDYDTYKFSDVDTFLKAISYGGELYKKFVRGYIFRGHSKLKYRLIPSSLRENKLCFPYYEEALYGDSRLYDKEHVQIFIEKELLRLFYEGCDETSLRLPFVNDINFSYQIDMIPKFPSFDEWIPESMCGLAALAQHHGVPTRLLDWTHEINTAIYFALSDYLKGTKPEADDCLVIWALNAILIEKIGKDFPLKFIKPLYSENPNLSAQKGLFTLWSIKYEKVVPAQQQRKGLECVVVNDVNVDRRPLDEILTDHFAKNPGTCKGTLLYKISIPIDIPPLYQYITKMKANAKYLFPGYDGVVREIKESKIVEILEASKTKE